MIVEKNNVHKTANSDFDIIGSPVAKKVQLAIISTGNKFITHIADLKNNYQPKCLNEKQLTQEFVALLERTLKNKEFPFCVQKDFSDIFNRNANPKRSVDFYFYPSKEGESTKSIYSVEVKRLPAPPPKNREKEYVIGHEKNKGGIERFKNKEHGKGLGECGMLAFVEDKTFQYWFSLINEWIAGLAAKNANWSLDEQLTEFEQSETCAKLYSSVYRTTKNLDLFHFWINNPTTTLTI